MTANTRRWRKKHPQKVKESRQKIYLNRKRRALEKLGGAFCSKCKCDELSFLEINHIDGGGAKEWKKNKCSLQDLILSGRRDPIGLNVLCRVCNAIDFLNRKNPYAAGQFITRYEKYSGQKAKLDS